MSLAQYDFDKFLPNSFALVLPEIPGIGRSDMFVLNVHSVNLPGLELGVKDVHWQGALTHVPEGMSTWGSLTAGFMVDETMSNWRTLFGWMTSIHNNRDKYVPNKPSDYSIDCSVLMLDNFRKPIVNFKFVNTWPTALAECQMSFREGTRYIDSSVTFTYDYYDVEALN